MKKVFNNKKTLLAILCGAIVVVVLILSLGNNILPEGFEKGPSVETDTSSSGLSSTEGLLAEGTTPAYVDEGEFFSDLPEGWEEENDAKQRQAVESEGYIKGEVIAEIDSEKQPQGISPETTISVNKGGYDIVIQGTAISGYTNILVYNEAGNTVGTKRTLFLYDEFRIENVPIGKYRVVVQRSDTAGVNVNCLLKICLELTTPKIELPHLIAKSQIVVANPYGAIMVFVNDGNKTTIGAKNSSVVKLAEGNNAIVYYLQDGGNSSARIDDSIMVDTSPPVIKLDNTYERYDEQGHEKVVFNMYVNEYPKYIKINGEDYFVGSVTDTDGPYPFAYIGSISEKSVNIEVCDLAGNITKTTLYRD